MFAINQKKSCRQHARIRYPDGRWGQQTSGCEDPRDAAETFETMQYFMNQSNKPRNNSRQALLRLMRKVYQEKYHEDCPLVLTDDFLKQIVETNRHYVAGSTHAQTAKTAEWYLKFLRHQAMEGVLLEDNKPPMIKSFGVYLLEVGKHNVDSANARLEKLETIFGEAVASRLLEFNPVKRVRLKDRQAESEEELEIHQPYSKEHVYKFIDSGIAPGCNPELAVFSLLGIDLGARGGDVFALDRSMFSRSAEMAKNSFKYYARKPKKWHKVYPFEPTVPLVQEYLDHHLLDQSDKALFFPTFGQSTGPGVTDASFNSGSAGAMYYYSRFLDELGIRQLLQSALGGKARYSHSSHSGRVQCVTMMAQANFPESVVRQRVLHSGAEVHRIYQKHSPEAVQRATSSAGACNDEGVVNITLEEFKTAVAYATERLRSLRGQLDLHDGTTTNGDMTNRACLHQMKPVIPVGSIVEDKAA